MSGVPTDWGGIIFHLKPLKTGFYFISYFSFQPCFWSPPPPLNLELPQSFRAPTFIFAPLRIASFSLSLRSHTIQGRRMARTFSMSMTFYVATLLFLQKNTFL